MNILLRQNVLGLGQFGNALSVTPFRRWWSQMLYTKSVFLKYSGIAL